MTKVEFRAALAELSLSYREAAIVLGVQKRAVVRYANGGSIPPTIAILMRHYWKHPTLLEEVRSQT